MSSDRELPDTESGPEPLFQAVNRKLQAELTATQAQRDALKAQVAECERVSLQRQFRVDEKVNGLTEQRDALLAALKLAVSRLDAYEGEENNDLRAAIVAAEGGGATDRERADVAAR